MPFCSQCGTSHANEVNFCPNCGTKVAQSHNGGMAQIHNPYAAQMNQIAPQKTSCGYCRGSGQIGMGSKCSACEGRGCVMVSDDTKCTKCDGRGSVGFAGRCTGCNGTGYRCVMKFAQVEAFMTVNEQCNYCRGSGHIGFGSKCSVCEGAKKVLTLPGKIACGYCRKSGQIGMGSKCSVCEGTGWAFSKKL